MTIILMIIILMIIIYDYNDNNHIHKEQDDNDDQSHLQVITESSLGAWSDYIRSWCCLCHHYSYHHCHNHHYNQNHFHHYQSKHDHHDPDIRIASVTYFSYLIPSTPSSSPPSSSYHLHHHLHHPPQIIFPGLVSSRCQCRRGSRLLIISFHHF